MITMHLDYFFAYAILSEAFMIYFLIYSYF